MKLTDFKSIVDQYKVIFFDAYGVLKNYQGIIDGISQTFEYLRKRDIGYFVLTNDASGSPQRLADKFNRSGLPHITADRIISSGMMAQEFLENKIPTGTVAYLGTEHSAHYIASIGLETLSVRELDLNHIDDIKAVLFLDDEGFDWNHDINKVMNLLRRKNIPVVVANSDKSYPVSKNEVWLATGAIADMVQDVTKKKFIKFGKPDAQMFIFAFEHIQAFQRAGKRDILMVGDTLSTDILGGNKFGLDTALVLTGNTQAEYAEQAIFNSGIIPTFICESAIIN